MGWTRRGLATLLLCLAGCAGKQSDPFADAGAEHAAAGDAGTANLGADAGANESDDAGDTPRDASIEGDAAPEITGDAALAITPGDARSHYPLVDGATWTYHHTKPGKADWDEVATVVATTYQKKPAFILEDEEDAQGVRTRSTLVARGTGVWRAYKEEVASGQVAVTTTYDPAFLRYDEAWVKAGQGMTLDDDWTTKCLIMSAASKCAPGSTKVGSTTHAFKVLDTSARLTVRAGTFDCVKVQRIEPDSGETKLFWFAAGVGKVREETPATQSVEELSSYDIP